MLQLYDLPVIPERRLLLAILERAIMDATENDRVCTDNRRIDGKIRSERNRKHVRQAQRWIFDDGEHDFGYLYVCQGLQINPRFIRKGVDAIIKHKLRLNSRTLRIYMRHFVDG